MLIINLHLYKIFAKISQIFNKLIIILKLVKLFINK